MKDEIQECKKCRSLTTGVKRGKCDRCREEEQYEREYQEAHG